MMLLYVLPCAFADIYREFGNRYRSEVMEVGENEIFKVQDGAKSD